MAQEIALISSLLILVQLSRVTSNIIPPILAPLFDDICKEVECGRGKCKASNDSLSYVCECDSGWNKVFSDNDDNLMFLPCVIPNCTMDYSCANAPPPQQNQRPTNQSFFDPCRWAECGGGTCNRTSPFTHTCECTEGYYNLLNSSAFPCLRDCTLGMDCSTLGIGLVNRTSSPQTQTQPQNLPSNDSTQVSSILFSDFNWMVLLMTSLVLLLQIYNI